MEEAALGMGPVTVAAATAVIMGAATAVLMGAVTAAMGVVMVDMAALACMDGAPWAHTGGTEGTAHTPATAPSRNLPRYLWCGITSCILGTLIVLLFAPPQ